MALAPSKMLRARAVLPAMGPLLFVSLAATSSRDISDASAARAPRQRKASRSSLTRLRHRGVHVSAAPSMAYVFCVSLLQPSVQRMSSHLAARHRTRREHVVGAWGEGTALGSEVGERCVSGSASHRKLQRAALALVLAKTTASRAC